VQVGFLNIVGLPLFKAMADVFEDSAPLYEGALANFQAWEAAAAEDALQRTGSAASRSDAGSQAWEGFSVQSIKRGKDWNCVQLFNALCYPMSW